MKKVFAVLFSVLMLASCAGSNTVATVGTTKITQGEFEFYLSSIKNQMKGTEIQTDEDWETKEIEGKKAIDAAKQRALDIAVKNVEYRDIAILAGITLSDGDKALVKSTKERVISNNGGKSGYNKFLKENNITDKFIDMMCESTVYYNKITELVKEQTPITDEELKSKFESSDISSEYRKAKHILIMTVDSQTRKPLSEEEQANAKKLADQLLERAKNGEDFDKLMNEYSQDPGLSSNPGGYVFGSGEMVQEFEQAVDSVMPGEITFCQSDYGYHIIKRLPLEFEYV
ncbi:MAG: peptidylprolyl isomerase, partial [Clostridiales bacterium]|nr:peptidylprolyl isomerase [Clostridiales bacterium]